MSKWVRLAVCVAVVVCVACGAAVCQTADPQIEPGLTSRVATFAFLKLPSTSRQSLSAIQWQVVERLQTLPVLQPSDHAGQLGLIFNQVSDNVASPELLASAARAVVALMLPGGSAPDGWTAFREGVALRSQLSEVSLGTVPVVTDPAAFAADVKKAGDALKAQALEAVKTGDGAKLTELRAKAVSEATRCTVAVWVKMLQLQAPPAKSTTAAAVSAPVDRSTTSAVSEQVAEPDPGPVSYIGNKQSKKLHRAGCRFGPGPANTIPLSSREEAIRQGYEPCRVCRP